MTWDVIISGIVGCCAMLAKETGITVLGINVLYDLYLHKDQVKRYEPLWCRHLSNLGDELMRLIVSFQMASIIFFKDRG